MVASDNKFQIHDMDMQYRSAVKTMNEKNITEYNKEILMLFDRYLKVNICVTLTRRIKYLRILSKCAELLGKDFNKAKYTDIQNTIEKIDDSKWAPATKKDHKMLLKRFYKWLLGNDEEYPKIVAWIKAKIEYNINTRKDELLTDEDINKMLAVAQNSRDKAIIHVLYESGCRIGELGSMRIKDVSFDKWGVQINVNGKTGERTIRLVKSASDLSYWVKHHPNTNDSEACLWCSFTNTKECLGYSAYVKIINTHFDLAKIDKKKKHHPHSFRHCALTRLSAYLTDQEIKIYAGWTKTSSMVDVYNHLTGGDVANKILKINGISKDNLELEEKPLLCPRCSAPNSQNEQFCYNCGFLLDEKIANKPIITPDGEELMKSIKSNPKALELMQQLAEILNNNPTE
jgi:integrase